MEMLSKEYRKARKSHTCDWCGCEIEPGTVYEIQGCKHKRELYTFKNHTECMEIAVDNNWFEDSEGLTEVDFDICLSELVSNLSIDNSLTKFEQVKACLET